MVTAVTKTSVSFRLPQLGTTAVESLEITLNGYEAGKTAWDVSLTAPECMNLPELDNPTYPPYIGLHRRMIIFLVVGIILVMIGVSCIIIRR